MASMFDSAHPLASGWLWGCVLVFTACFGLPLTVAPLRWARWFGWAVPAQGNELTIYLGRCLGTVVLVLAYLIAGAASAPARAGWALQLITLAGAGMTAVHAWGWVRRAQPRSENIETIGYAIVTGVTWWISATMA
jgi:hypothetical protein